jgi:hypothetical protein
MDMREEFVDPIDNGGLAYHKQVMFSFLQQAAEAKGAMYYQHVLNVIAQHAGPGTLETWTQLSQPSCTSFSRQGHVHSIVFERALPFCTCLA